MAPRRGRKKQPVRKPISNVDTTINLKPIGIDTKVHLKKSFHLPTLNQTLLGLAGLGIAGGGIYYASRNDMINVGENYERLRQIVTEPELQRMIRSNIRINL